MTRTSSVALEGEVTSIGASGGEANVKDCFILFYLFLAQFLLRSEGIRAKLEVRAVCLGFDSRQNVRAGFVPYFCDVARCLRKEEYRALPHLTLALIVAQVGCHCKENAFVLGGVIRYC